MKIAFSVLLCAILAVVNSMESSSTEIIHPSKLKIMESSPPELHIFPKYFSFYVVLRREHKVFCCGALISKKHVLTAASCVYNLTFPYPVEVVVGIGKNTQAGHGIAEIYILREFDPNKLSPDIAVVSLIEEVILEHVKPISYSRYDIRSGQYGIQLGWFPAHDSEYKAGIELRIIFLRKIPLSPTWRFTNSDKKGNTVEDTGAPVIYHGKIIGITSFKSHTKRRVINASYTKVFVYNKFIKEAIANNRSSCQPIQNNYLAVPEPIKPISFEHAEPVPSYIRMDCDNVLITSPEFCKSALHYIAMKDGAIR